MNTPTRSATDIVRKSWPHRFVCIGVLASTCLISSSVLAGGTVDPGIGGEGYGEGALLASLELVNIAIAFMATMLFLGVSRRLGLSREGIAIGYITTGIALLGMTRVFYILADRGVIFVHDDTLEFWWHILFFMAMIVFIFGAKVLSPAVAGEGRWLCSPRVLRNWVVVSILVTLATFLTAEPLDQTFVAVFDDTLTDRFGVQHFAAFVLSDLALLQAIVAFGTQAQSPSEDIIGRLKMPLIITYSLFALDHFWELLFESWEIFTLSETLIERVEQIIVFPAFLILVYAGRRLQACGQPGADADAQTRVQSVSAG